MAPPPVAPIPTEEPIRKVAPPLRIKLLTPTTLVSVTVPVLVMVKSPSFCKKRLVLPEDTIKVPEIVPMQVEVKIVLILLPDPSKPVVTVFPAEIL